MTKEGYKLTKKDAAGHRLWARKGQIVCDICKTSKTSPARERRKVNGQLP